MLRCCWVSWCFLLTSMILAEAWKSLQLPLCRSSRSSALTQCRSHSRFVFLIQFNPQQGPMPTRRWMNELDTIADSVFPSSTSSSSTTSTSDPVPDLASAESRKVQEEIEIDPRLLKEYQVVMRSYPPRKKQGPPAPNTWRKNLPRKIKRKLKNIDSDGLKEIVTAELDDYLRLESKGNVHDNLMRKLGRAALRNNVTLPDGFGVKPRPLRPTIMEALESFGNFTVLQKVISTAKTPDLFNTSTLLTLFAPSDAAFSKLGNDTIQGLLDNCELAQAFINHLLVSGTINTKSLCARKETPLDAMDGTKLPIKTSKPDGGDIDVDSVRIVTPNIECYRGIIHVVDSANIPSK